MRSQRGQASVEWVAVVALVAAVLTAALAATGTAPAAAVVNGVHRGVLRAFCVVTGDGCPGTEVQACTVTRRDKGYELGFKALVVSYSQRGVVVRTALSDGSIELTLLEGLGVGAEVTTGTARLQVGGHAVGVQVGASGALTGDADRSRTWRLTDPAAARRLQGDLRRYLYGDLLPGGVSLAQRVTGRGLLTGALPRPDVVTRRGGLQAGADAVASAGAEAKGDDAATPGAEAKAGVKGSASVRVSVDRRTGRRTTTYLVQGEAAAALRAVQKLDGAEATGALELSITRDAAGRPLLVATVEHGAGALPQDAPRPRGGADDVEVTRSLDLTSDAAAAASVAALDAALRAVSPARALRAAQALRRRLDGGQVDVRAYATRNHAPLDVAGEVGLGVKAGVSAKVSLSDAQLRDAWVRPAGGLWQQRADCLGS